MKTLASLFVVGSCLAAASAYAQNVYKWKDAQGTTHYTDQPPPPGSHASTVKLRSGAETSATAPAAAAPASTPTVAASGTPSPLAAAEAATRQRNCERAKENLATLASGAMLVDGSDPESAKRLQPYQIEDAKRAARGEVSTYCDQVAK